MEQRAGKQRRRRKRGKKQVLCWVLLLFLCVILWNTLFTKEYTIAIDPGHGGEDVGAVGVIEEVSLTETTAAFLEERLQADGRFRVVLTREAGEGKTFAKRKAKVWLSRADILLSIHGNADEKGTATGFECYPAPPAQKNHKKSLRFGKILAEEMEGAGSTLRGENGIRYGYYIPDATGVAQKTIKEATDTTPYSYPSFAMVEGFSCPAVLVEQCFLTSPSDVAKFGTEEGCKKAAEAYYQGICRMLAKEPKEDMT